MTDEQDMVLVNPGGRVVAVPYELGQELLAQPGFRQATAVQAKELEQYAKATVGAVLATKEAKRLKAEKAAAEAFFNSPDSDVSVDPNAVIAAEADAANHPINGPVAPADDKPKSRKSK